MDHFELVSEYAPTGDQPQAIEQLVKGFQEGNQCQTLLGVTGSGKTFTMANVIQQLNKPTLIINPRSSSRSRPEMVRRIPRTVPVVSGLAALLTYSHRTKAAIREIAI